MASNIHSHQHMIGPVLMAGGHAENGVPYFRFSTLTPRTAGRQHNDYGDVLDVRRKILRIFVFLDLYAVYVVADL